MQRWDLVNRCIKFVQQDVFHRIFPISCLICYAPCHDNTNLCDNCYADLPKIKSSCQHCAIPISEGEDICGQCLKKPMFEYALAAFEYTWPLDEFVYQLKYKQRQSFGPILGALMAKAISPRTRPQALMPVPLHERRYRDRGFNQAFEIAKILGRAYQIPVITTGALRQKPTQPQSKVKKASRKINLQNAFAINGQLNYQHIAIIDDVMTTGQTAQSLAQCLLKNGVKSIECWCCCRTPLR